MAAPVRGGMGDFLAERERRSQNACSRPNVAALVERSFKWLWGVDRRRSVIGRAIVDEGVNVSVIQ